MDVKEEQRKQFLGAYSKRDWATMHYLYQTDQARSLIRAYPFLVRGRIAILKGKEASNGGHRQNLCSNGHDTFPW